MRHLGMQTWLVGLVCAVVSPLIVSVLVVLGLLMLAPTLVQSDLLLVGLLYQFITLSIPAAFLGIFMGYWKSSRGRIQIWIWISACVLLLVVSGFVWSMIAGTAPDGGSYGLYAIRYSAMAITCYFIVRWFPIVPPRDGKCVPQERA